MAGSSGFFDATELADGTWDKTYVAEQFAKYFAMFVGNGVFANPANQLKVVSADNGMYVTVKSGRAFINGYWFELDADYTFAVQINDTSTNDRIDGVFVQLDTSEGVIDIVYEAGRSEVNRTAPIYELKLCDIAVPIASTQISNSQITDKRAYDSVCGFVANLVQITSTEELFTQWTTAYNEWYDALLTYEDAKKEEFESWIANRQSVFNSWRSTQEEDFADWFNRMKDQLSEDAAGNLQLQIDEEKAFTRSKRNEIKTYLNNEKGGFVTEVIEATEWENNQYSLEEDYPSNSYDILTIIPDPSATNYEAEKKAWDTAQLRPYNSSNILIATKTAPTIDVNVVMYVKPKPVPPDVETVVEG